MIKASDIKRFQNMGKALKTIGEFKALGRELRDEFSLTDREALDILNGKNEIEILCKYENKKETK